MHQLPAILALLLCFQISLAAEESGESKSETLIGLTPDVYVIGTWPRYLKDINECENFRQNTTPPLFRVWPENEGAFCCEDKKTPHTIASYVHAEKNGRYLHPIAYYDVGIVNDFTPFWTSWRPDRVSQKDITNLAYCEVNDLKRFYVLRFWREALAKQGLLYSGIPFVLVAEFLVVLAAIPSFVQWPVGVSRLSTIHAFWGWESTWNVIHLILLGVNGSLLMEAVGHWDPCGWVAVVLYNLAIAYAYLSLLSFLSTVAQQVALWYAVTTNIRLHLMAKKLGSRTSTSTPIPCKVQPYKIEKEWQLQRIASQCAVSFIASLYCTLVTVYARDDFVSWLLGVIILAQVWPCIVEFIVLYKAYKVVRSCWKVFRFAREQEKAVALENLNDGGQWPL